LFGKKTENSRFGVFSVGKTAETRFLRPKRSRESTSVSRERFFYFGLQKPGETFFCSACLFGSAFRFTPLRFRFTF